MMFGDANLQLWCCPQYGTVLEMCEEGEEEERSSM